MRTYFCNVIATHPLSETSYKSEHELFVFNLSLQQLKHGQFHQPNEHPNKMLKLISVDEYKLLLPMYVSVVVDICPTGVSDPESKLLCSNPNTEAEMLSVTMCANAGSTRKSHLQQVHSIVTYTSAVDSFRFQN